MSRTAKIEADEGEILNTLSARKLRSAEKSIELGDSLSIGAAGGEVLYHDDTGAADADFFAPRKRVDIIGLAGTVGAFTQGRIVNAFATNVVQSVFTLRSDDITAATTNNDDATKVKFIRTTPAGEDFIVKEFRFRFDTVQTGIRLVIRRGTATGKVVFSSEETFIWEKDEGITSIVYAGSPATETVLDLTENPTLLEANTAYHFTIESFGKTLVMLGTLVSGEYEPYQARVQGDALVDPVVALGHQPITANLIMPESDWYSNVIANATSGNIQITLPSASAGTNLGLPIYINKTDSSANTVTIVPFAGQTINGAANIILNNQNDSVILISDGTNVRTLSQNIGGWTDDGTVVKLINSADAVSIGPVTSAIAKVTMSGSALSGTDPALAIHNSFSDGNYIDIGNIRKIGIFVGGNLFMGYNFDYDATANTYKRQAADEAAGVEFTVDGDVDFRTAPTGAIGSSFVPTTRMRVLNAGNIDFLTNKILNISDATAATDGVNKGQLATPFSFTDAGSADTFTNTTFANFPTNRIRIASVIVSKTSSIKIVGLINRFQHGNANAPTFARIKIEKAGFTTQFSSVFALGSTNNFQFKQMDLKHLFTSIPAGTYNIEIEVRVNGGTGNILNDANGTGSRYLEAIVIPD